MVFTTSSAEATYGPVEGIASKLQHGSLWEIVKCMVSLSQMKESMQVPLTSLLQVPHGFLSIAIVLFTYGHYLTAHCIICENYQMWNVPFLFLGGRKKKNLWITNCRGNLILHYKDDVNGTHLTLSPSLPVEAERRGGSQEHYKGKDSHPEYLQVMAH